MFECVERRGGRWSLRGDCRRGFAVTELLVVVVILAVLLAIAVPIYGGIQQTAGNRVDEANVRILNGATLQWVLEDDANDPRAHTTESLKSILEGYLITKWPESPNGKSYVLDDGLWKAE